MFDTHADPPPPIPLPPGEGESLFFPSVVRFFPSGVPSPLTGEGQGGGVKHLRNPQ